MHQSRTQEIQGSNPTEGNLLLNNLVNEMAEGRQYFTEMCKIKLTKHLKDDSFIIISYD